MNSAALVLVIDSGRVLSIARNGENTYGLIGGKVDPGETVKQAAIREAKEEASIDIKNCFHIFTKTETSGSESFKVSTFLVSDWEGKPSPSDEGEVLWLKPQDLMGDHAAFRDYNRSLFEYFKQIYPILDMVHPNKFNLFLD